MCLPSCCCLVELLPYLLLATTPFYGSFCGLDIILRLSILLLLHSVIIHFIPKQWKRILPYSQILLLVILVYLPVNITPVFILWLYRIVLLLSEPVLKVLEVILVQNYVMRCSQRIIDEWDSDDAKTRGLLISFSSLCYGISSTLAWSMYSDGTNIQIWCLLIVVVVFVMVHNMMVISPEGILSDAAFCSLCSVSVLYAMQQESTLTKQLIQTPPSWARHETSSFVGLFFSIMRIKSEYAVQAIEFLKLFFLTPYFYISLVIRLYSILFIVDKVNKNILHDDDSIEEAELDISTEEDLMLTLSPWRSPLFTRLSLIFMFTQITYIFLSEISGQTLLMQWVPSVHRKWPTEILFGRVLQMLAVNSFYMWRLFRADEWTWSEWL